MDPNVQSVLGQAWQQFRDQALSVLPHLLAGLFVFAAGLAIGIIVSRLAKWVLTKTNIDARVSQLGFSASLDAIGITSAVRLVAGTLQVVILIVTANLALYSLDAKLASDLAERFFLYLPHLIVALVILGAGLLVARFLARSALIAAVNNEVRSARLLAACTRVAVMIVAGTMAFEHLGISRETVLIAFAILFGGATLAASLAAGLAMQDVVRRWVADQLPAGTTQQGQGPGIEHW